MDTRLDPNGGVLVAVALLGQVQPIPAQSGTLTIANVTLIDGTGAAARERVTILIRDGLIAGVMDADKAVVPDGTRLIDGTGKFVIPGLADMHVHFGTGGLRARSTRSPWTGCCGNSSSTA